MAAPAASPAAEDWETAAEQLEDLKLVPASSVSEDAQVG